MTDSEKESMRKEGRRRKKKPGVQKEKRQRDRGEGIEKGSLHKEEKEGEEAEMKRGSKRKTEKGRGDSRRQSEADVLGSFRAMSRICVQTSHGQHTKQRTQCPDPDSCQ